MAACVGATWIACGVVGTIELPARSLRTGGIILIGEPYWRQATAGEYYVGLTSDPAPRLRAQRRPATPDGTPPAMADARMHRVRR